MAAVCATRITSRFGASSGTRLAAGTASDLDARGFSRTRSTNVCDPPRRSNYRASTPAHEGRGSELAHHEHEPGMPGLRAEVSGVKDRAGSGVEVRGAH